MRHQRLGVSGLSCAKYRAWAGGLLFSERRGQTDVACAPGKSPLSLNNLQISNQRCPSISVCVLFELHARCLDASSAQRASYGGGFENERVRGGSFVGASKAFLSTSMSRRGRPSGSIAVLFDSAAHVMSRRGIVTSRNCRGHWRRRHGDGWPTGVPRSNSRAHERTQSSASSGENAIR